MANQTNKQKKQMLLIIPSFCVLLYGLQHKAVRRGPPPKSRDLPPTPFPAQVFIFPKLEIGRKPHL